MMHKSQFRKMYPYDWFCGPGSQMFMSHEIITMHNLDELILYRKYIYVYALGRCFNAKRLLLHLKG